MSYLIALIIMAISLSVTAAADPFDRLTSWPKVKNIMDDEVYSGARVTFYCGCPYQSDEDNDGSGSVDVAACGYEPVAKYEKRAHRIEWEHVVPVSRMPWRDMACWADGKRRACAKRHDQARRAFYDPNNLVPAIGQVNALRSNDYYGEAGSGAILLESCGARDEKSRRGENRARFEPADCLKGDVARITNYMVDQYGIEIPAGLTALYQQWAADDPYSPEEEARAARIAGLGFKTIAEYGTVRPSADGSCKKRF